MGRPLDNAPVHCRDGAACHHKCESGRCYRERHCAPLSGYSGPWGNVSADIQRYELIDTITPGSGDHRECAKGDWVHYDDHAAVIAEKNTEIERIRKELAARKKLGKSTFDVAVDMEGEIARFRKIEAAARDYVRSVDEASEAVDDPDADHHLAVNTIVVADEALRAALAEGEGS